MLMISNKYNTETGLIATSISGGRPHHSYRQPVKALNQYEYELAYGENFHTLSAIIFGSDEYYWILADNNKPMDAFAMGVYDKIKLPKGVVTKTDVERRIF